MERNWHKANGEENGVGKRAGLLGLVSAFIMLALLVLGWLLIYRQHLPVVDGKWMALGEVDLAQIDMKEYIVRLPQDWEYYPEQLYEPEDFALGRPMQPQLYKEVTDAAAMDYGTYRMILHLKPDRYYSISGFSLNYGTRVYANGQLLMEIGFVADNAQRAVPRVNHMLLPFYSDSSGQVELVMQYSNFVHREGGKMKELVISTPANMAEYVENQRLPANLVGCGLLALFAYYLIRAAIRSSPIALSMAFCCVVFALREQELYLIQLLPWDYNWFLHYRVVILIVGLIPFSTLTMAREFYPDLVPKWISWAYNGLFAGKTLLLFLLPTQVSVDVCVGFHIISAVYGGWMLLCGIRGALKERHVGLRDGLMIGAIVQLCLISMMEMGLSWSVPQTYSQGLTPFACVAFVLITMGLEVREEVQREQALVNSRYRNALLRRLNELKSDFLQEMAHELKTPLTVISGYAQLATWQINQEDVRAETVGNLNTICRETARLSDLVTRLLNKAEDREEEALFKEVDVAEVFAQARAVLQPVLLRKNNTLKTLRRGCETVFANQEMLLQVLLNLGMNANRHMENGTLLFDVTTQGETSGLACFRVKDTGSGIDEKDRPHVFEKGFSTDGSKGLGLPICREMVEQHGGTINIEQTDASGTTIRFTIWEREEGRK